MFALLQRSTGAASRGVSAGRSRRAFTHGLVVVTGATLALLAAGPASADVTGAADNLRTGWYPDEPSLTPALVSSGSFQQDFDRPLQGQLYAQPLVADGTLLVVTEDDRAYGLDPVTGATRWERTFGTPVEAEDPEIECEDLSPQIGITGTPVIDTATNVAYFVSNSYVNGSTGPIAWYMQAIEMGSGKEAAGFPVEIAGEAQNLAGVQFVAAKQLQRPALLLMNGVIYAGFGSHCDKAPFQGWVVGVSTGGQLRTIWATTPGGGSIWQSGGGLISDRPGQILFATSNGPGDEAEAFPLPGPGDDPPEGRLAESVVRVEVQPDATLRAIDFFSPFNNELLDATDLDLGSAAPIALPSEYFGTKQVPDLLLQPSKEGKMYLLNRDDLGGVAQGPEKKDAVVQTLEGGGVWDGSALWPGNGGYVYVPSVSPGAGIGASNGYLRTFKYGVEQATEEPTLSLAAKSPETYGFGSGSPIVTSDGTTGGTAILWLTQCPPSSCEGAKLRAYDAVPSAGALPLLWEAPIGTANKFSRPDAASGHIYVGDAEGHIFGYSAPMLTPSTTSLALGAASTGTQLTGEVTLTNTGPTDLTVNAAHSPSAPFEASGLPETGAVIAKGQTIAVHVSFRSAAPGSFTGSLGVGTAVGEVDVALTASAAAPPEPGGGDENTTTAPLTTPIVGTLLTTSPSIPLAGPPLSLTHLHLTYPASRRGRGRREIRLTFTLSATGSLEIAIDRRVTSHRCQRAAHTCTRYLPTAIRLVLAGHAGMNAVTLDLAKLSMGDYRLALTPAGTSGKAGATRYGLFRVLR
jgi:hypothetical protein